MQERAREKDPLSLSTRTRLAYEGRSSYFTTAGHCTCLSQEWVPLAQNCTVSEIFWYSY